MLKLQNAWLRLAAIFIAAAVLCWPALTNGGPFQFSDTSAYIRGPDVAIMKLFGKSHATAWATHDPGAIDQRVRGVPRAEITTPSYDDDEVMAGRSIYYGALAFLGVLAGGLWLTVFIQGLAVAILVDIVLRALRIESLVSYAATILLVSAITSAPFFVSFVMPDIWAGIAIAGMAALIAFAPRLSHFDMALLALLLVFGAMSHNTHILIIGVLLVVSLVFKLVARRSRHELGPALVVGSIALLAAYAGHFFFGYMVERTTGKPPVLPPFITARLTADEPGARFVKEHCETVRFEVCRFAKLLPMPVDQFLWDTNPETGVFQVAPSESRRALSEEQVWFALAVTSAYPLEQLGISLVNALRQSMTMDLVDFSYGDTARDNLDRQVPEKYLGALHRTLAYRGEWPVGFFTGFHLAAFVLALGTVIYVGLSDLRRSGGDNTGPRMMQAAALSFAVFILIGIIANAGICGALSSVQGRYQARVAWLLPFAAFLILLLRVRHPAPPLEQASAPERGNSAMSVIGQNASE